jgi:hypothetical protein
VHIPESPEPISGEIRNCCVRCNAVLNAKSKKKRCRQCQKATAKEIAESKGMGYCVYNSHYVRVNELMDSSGKRYQVCNNCRFKKSKSPEKKSRRASTVVPLTFASELDAMDHLERFEYHLGFNFIYKNKIRIRNNIISRFLLCSCHMNPDDKDEDEEHHVDNNLIEIIEENGSSNNSVGDENSESDQQSSISSVDFDAIDRAHVSNACHSSDSNASNSKTKSSPNSSLSSDPNASLSALDVIDENSESEKSALEDAEYMKNRFPFYGKYKRLFSDAERKTVFKRSLNLNSDSLLSRVSIKVGCRKAYRIDISESNVTLHQLGEHNAACCKLGTLDLIPQPIHPVLEAWVLETFIKGADIETVKDLLHSANPIPGRFIIPKFCSEKPRYKLTHSKLHQLHNAARKMLLKDPNESIATAKWICELEQEGSVLHYQQGECHCMVNKLN